VKIEHSTEVSFGDTGDVSVTMGFQESSPTAALHVAEDVFFKDEGGDIKDFLSRPRLVLSGDFTSTDTGTTFNSFNLMRWIQLNYADKLKGKYAMSFDVVFNIEVSADRFQQGRYIFAYMPTYYQNITGGGSAACTPGGRWYNNHRATLTQTTQLQHVEFDLNVDKSAQLRIPWRYINPFIEIGSTTDWSGASAPDYGVCFMAPYVPMAYGSGGSSTASFNVWMSLENVSFYGTANYQSNAEKEAESVGDGPISGPLTKITGVLSGVADVPFVGHYAKPASWVTDALARAAKHFGFSSPKIQSGISPMANMPNAYNANADVPRPVQSLALTINNGVTTDPRVSGAKIDEMSIDYLKGIFAYKGTYNLSTSNSVNDTLMAIPVSPIRPKLSSTITDSVGPVSYVLNHHGPLGYIATRFRFWRGGIKYRIKIAKTEFHTGKLLIAWAPYDPLVQTDGGIPTVDSSYYSYRHIVDLSMGNEFEFTVPYMSPRPWKDVYAVENGGWSTNPQTIANARFANTDWINGNVRVLVLEKLKCPSACNPTISFVLEMAGAEDFQFSSPMANTLYDNGVSYQPGQIGWISYFQSNKENSVIANFSFGGHSSLRDSQSVRVCEIAGGEKIDSLRKLMKRYTTCLVTPNGVTDQFLANAWSNMGLMQVNSTDVANNPHYADDFAFFGAMFTLFRGSVRYKVYCDANGTQSGSITRHQLEAVLVGATPGMRNTTTTIPAVYDVPSVFNVDSPASTGRAIVSIALSEALEFSIPYYARDYHYAVQAMYQLESKTGPTVTVAAPGTIGVPTTSALVKLHYPTAITLQKRFERSLGEDASFSYFVSCPPVYDPRDL